MLFFGCQKESEKEQLQDVKVISGSHSDCLGSKSARIVDSGELYVVKAIGGNNYLIEHQNANFNCCLPEGIAFVAEMSNDTLFFTDYEKVAGNCKCMCTYNTSAEIGEIEEGNYTLCLTTGESFVGSVQLNFKSDMYVEISVSELIESL